MLFRSWFERKTTVNPMTITGVNVDSIKYGKIIEHGGAANLFEPLFKAGVMNLQQKTGQFY